MLLRDLAALVARDRRITAALLAHLAEVDARKLYLPAGYPSMHAYCVGELRLSEDAANKRIRVARKAREIPALFAAIAEGRLHLSGATLLATHLTVENANELMMAAEGRSKSDIEAMLAVRFPRSETLPMVETVPASGVGDRPGVEATAAANTAAPVPVSGNELAPGPVRAPIKTTRAEPIARERYEIRVSVGQATYQKLRHAQALLSHRIPSGDLAAVLDRVLDLAIERLEKRKFGARSGHPSIKRSTNPQHFPAQVKHAVWKRDGGQCTFVSESGHRCAAPQPLEFDHVVPVARGGRSTVENLRLRCRAHNQYEAERAFGVEFMRGKRGEARQAAARKKALTQARARAEEIIPGLRHLGFTADEARQAAAFCEGLPGASLEERFRSALSYLRPRKSAYAFAASASG
jgi:hypothetical protein